MKTRAAVAIFACIGALAAAPARAVDAAPPTISSLPPLPQRAAAPPAPATPASAPAPMEADAALQRGGEPAVRHTVIDDGRARIEELRIRGQLQKVTVEPKGRMPGYEVLVGNGVQAIDNDPGTSRGAAGKRVWNVLRF